jgi:hypothetical protein
VVPGALEFGLALAQGWFALTFRGRRDRFWHRMTMTGLNLGGLALLTSRPARGTRIGPKEVALGLASAATLYATFRVGDVFARRFVPGGDAQIRDIYTLRRRSSSGAASSRRRSWRGTAGGPERRWPPPRMAVSTS